MNTIRNLPTPETVASDDSHWGHKIDSGGYMTAIAEQWVNVNGREDDKPHAVEGTLFRASMAGSCLNQLGRYMLRDEKSDPPTPADLYRMDVGSVLHQFVQSTDVFGADAEFEVPFEIPEISLSGSADVVTDDAVIEIKSAGGFPFKRIGIFNNATGPKEMHLRQAALAAHALGKANVIIIYIGLEVVNAGDVEKYGITDEQRWLAEYHYTLAELQHLVDEEIERHTVVRVIVEQGEMPPRHMPDMPKGATINRSKKKGKATWTLIEPQHDGKMLVVDTGTHWACDYCRYQGDCQTDLDRGF